MNFNTNGFSKKPKDVLPRIVKFVDYFYFKYEIYDWIKYVRVTFTHFIYFETD